MSGYIPATTSPSMSLLEAFGGVFVEVALGAVHVGFEPD